MIGTENRREGRSDVMCACMCACIVQIAGGVGEAFVVTGHYLKC